MFTTTNVRLHLTKAALKMEQIGDDESQPVMAIGLVLEPLTQPLAKQLHPDIAEHCFTRAGKIRDDVGQLRLKLKHKSQAVLVRMAEDQQEPSATLRYVRFPMVTITVRGEAETAKAGKKKSKTIAPGKKTLRATLSGLVDPAEREQREFLYARFGELLLYTFEPEDRDLPFGHNEDDDQTPGIDGAGDVLDEQRELQLKDKTKPRLTKGKSKANGVAPAEA